MTIMKILFTYLFGLYPARRKQTLSIKGLKCKEEKRPWHRLLSSVISLVCYLPQSIYSKLYIPIFASKNIYE